MKRTRLINAAVIGVLLLAGGLVGVLIIHFHQPEPEDKYITITARKYAFEPAVIRVNKGDRLHVSLMANDVTHGFFLEGYDVDAQIPPGDFTFRLRHPSVSKEFEKVEEFTVVATHTGKFRYRCSNTCGYMHPFMQGELIVRPNYMYSATVGMTMGLAIGMIAIFRRNGKGERS